MSATIRQRVIVGWLYCYDVQKTADAKRRFFVLLIRTMLISLSKEDRARWVKDHEAVLKTMDRHFPAKDLARLKQLRKDILAEVKRDKL